MTAHPWAWAYFASFVVLAVFIVVNLFIAVVINNLEAAKAEERREEASGVWPPYASNWRRSTANCAVAGLPRPEAGGSLGLSQILLRCFGEQRSRT
jgi:hypothetical protein